jgi:phosphate:Na+ symporter
MNLLLIAGGVCLILFGVRFLRKGLDRLFGGKLIGWLGRMTEKPWKAFGAGIAVGTVAPSSTAISLVTVQLLDTGKIGAERMLAILLGAHVGIGITVQMLAFSIQNYFSLFLLTGVIGFQFLQRDLFRGIGQCLLSLGFVFLAIKLIGEGAAQFSAEPGTREILSLIQGHSLVVLIATTLLAILLQSSTATIVIGMGLATGGILTVPLIIPWVIGTNLGISLTVLTAGWPTMDGKRLGIANLLIKLAAALPLLLFPSWADWLFSHLPGSLPRQIAVLHTGYNLAAGLIALPFLAPICRLAEFFLPQPPVARDAFDHSATFLDPLALESPALALAYATRETLHMADEVKGMFRQFWKAEIDYNPDLARRVQQQDDRVDALNREIKRYLSGIREGMNDSEVKWQFTLLTFSNELESVGDLLDKNLCDSLLKRHAEGVILTLDDRNSLETLYQLVSRRLDWAVSLLIARDEAQAQAFLTGKDILNDWCRRAQWEHYERLRSGDCQTITGSSYFLDTLNSLRRINSHVSTIAYSFYTPPVRERSTPLIGNTDPGWLELGQNMKTENK